MISKYTAVEGNSREYYTLLLILAAVVGVGLLTFLYIEHYGHGVTGMTNKVVWGLPHIFAISLLVMASGALNLASMATVFGNAHYKQFRRFSAFLAISLLVGGLMVLVLDLGRPDRMLLTMLHMNLKSMFTWNVFLYSGFVLLCFFYLWAMMSNEKYVKLSGSAAFAGRVILTTGTGSIFGVIHAREVFHSAITAPTFIAVSLTSGTAVCILLLVSTFRMTGRELDEKLIRGMRNALIFFTFLVLYLMVVEKFTKFYSPAFYEVETWIMTGPYAWLYWFGIIGIGIIVPLVIMVHRTWGNDVNAIMVAAVAAIIGEVAFVAHVLLAGQSYPFNPFPGYEVSSTFQDGAVASYVPAMPELLLGMGGVAMAGLIYIMGIKFFRLLPKKAEAPESWNPWSP
uniref:Integral membrane subunit DsrP, involved in the intracellular sulfur oxidation. NrfD superfamily protein n=1 Tax=Magnetococcus massalia (strain MO-1) TaxID=451514 RepID=A0A1S7LDI5_MAGMO|nr:Integral membrane subunit DsrP, involved in the intracellular sulfur oxidation. NrfD superfamily protein [Candidatus Magnetococcus massalia]